MLAYKIVDCENREGNKKAIPEDWKLPLIASRIKIGHSAILPFVDCERGTYIATSKVEDVTIYDNTIMFTTKNSTYWLQPQMEVN